MSPITTYIGNRDRLGRRHLAAFYGPDGTRVRLRGWTEAGARRRAFRRYYRTFAS